MSDQLTIPSSREQVFRNELSLEKVQQSRSLPIFKLKLTKSFLNSTTELFFHFREFYFRNYNIFQTPPNCRLLVTMIYAQEVKYFGQCWPHVVVDMNSCKKCSSRPLR